MHGFDESKWELKCTQRCLVMMDLMESVEESRSTGGESSIDGGGD